MAIRVTILILFISALICSETVGQQPKTPVKLVAARADFQKAVDLAKAKNDEVVKEASEAYKRKLNDLLQEETKAGNLDGALLIREEINNLKPEPTANKKVATKADLAKALTGTKWDWGDAPITFQGDGFIRQANWESFKQVTKWEAVDRRTVAVTIVEANRKTDRLMIFVFSEALDEFGGIDFFGGRIISKKRMPLPKK